MPGSGPWASKHQIWFVACSKRSAGPGYDRSKSEREQQRQKIADMMNVILPRSKDGDKWHPNAIKNIELYIDHIDYVGVNGPPEGWYKEQLAQYLKILQNRNFPRQENRQNNPPTLNCDIHDFNQQKSQHLRNSYDQDQYPSRLVALGSISLSSPINYGQSSDKDQDYPSGLHSLAGHERGGQIQQDRSIGRFLQMIESASQQMNLKQPINDFVYASLLTTSEGIDQLLAHGGTPIPQIAPHIPALRQIIAYGRVSQFGRSCEAQRHPAPTPAPEQSPCPTPIPYLNLAISAVEHAKYHGAFVSDNDGCNVINAFFGTNQSIQNTLSAGQWPSKYLLRINSQLSELGQYYKENRDGSQQCDNIAPNMGVSVSDSITSGNVQQGNPPSLRTNNGRGWNVELGQKYGQTGERRGFQGGSECGRPSGQAGDSSDSQDSIS